MKKNYPKQKSTLIATIIVNLLIIVLGIFYYCKTRMVSILVVLCVPVGLIAFSIYAYCKEKKSDRKSKQDVSDFLDGTYFRNPQWKEKYLEYLIGHPYEVCDSGGMKADLCKRYRTKNTINNIIIGCLFLLFSPCVLFTEQSHLITAAIIAGLMFISVGIIFLTAPPVRKFFQKTDYDFNAIATSYVQGKIVARESHGVNFGNTHIVVFNHERVDAVAYEDIVQMTRKIARVKKYQDSIYVGEAYVHRLLIVYQKKLDAVPSRIEIELHEFQVEMALDEFSRRMYRESASFIEISEETDNAVTM